MKFIFSIVLLSVVSHAAALPQRFSRLGSRQGGDPQTSLTLDPKVIAKGFSTDGVGQENGIDPKTGKPNPPFAGPPSLKSTNNFINFCVGKTLTDGKQIKGGSCNPCPIGDIPSFQNMPGAKFVFPTNFDTSLAANTEFTIKMNVVRMKTGVLANPQTNFLAAPQQLAGDQIQGFATVVIEKLQSIDQSTPTNPGVFDFAAVIEKPAENGQLTKAVTGGLAAGPYRMCSILSAANSQPVIVPVAQHGNLDDCVYFTVGGGGGANGGNKGQGGANGGKNGQGGGKGGKNGQGGGQNGKKGNGGKN
ncbi:hypothetical protein DL96DRAFT_851542 [Flagelloscypha sp. PMI_526]|nr:hypothetical protein DL96DRAFT_851542 [Flagelloscypha sp. PMI_526]